MANKPEDTKGQTEDKGPKLNDGPVKGKNNEYKPAIYRTVKKNIREDR